MSRLTVRVNGIPAPQGSKSFRGRSKAGKAILVESSKAVEPWREAVRAEVQRAGASPISGPVAVDVTFWLPRPKGHYGVRGLRPSAPTRPIGRPDVDKLARAVLDGIVAGGAILDDSQVVDLRAVKMYAPEQAPPGAGITIESLS